MFSDVQLFVVALSAAKFVDLVDRRRILRGALAAWTGVVAYFGTLDGNGVLLTVLTMLCLYLPWIAAMTVRRRQSRAIAHVARDIESKRLGLYQMGTRTRNIHEFAGAGRRKSLARHALSGEVGVDAFGERLDANRMHLGTFQSSIGAPAASSGIQKRISFRNAMRSFRKSKSAQSFRQEAELVEARTASERVLPKSDRIRGLSDRTLSDHTAVSDEDEVELLVELDTVESHDLAPPKVLETLERSLYEFKLNLNSKVNQDEYSWREEVSGSGVKVFSSKVKAGKMNMWKAVANIPSRANPTSILQSLLSYAHRIGPNGWDGALSNGAVVKRFQSPTEKHRLIETVSYCTAAAAGGAVASRDFFGVRTLVEEVPEKTYYFTNVSLDSNTYDAVPKADDVLVRATNLSGGGFKLERLESGEWRYEMVSCVDLKGWLMQGVVNKATAAQLHKSTVAFVKHVSRVD